MGPSCGNDAGEEVNMYPVLAHGFRPLFPDATNIHVTWHGTAAVIGM
jgi:hypothetical protein